MIVISYHTRQPGYIACAARLKASCERFGIRHEIREIPDTGDWLSATHLKPRIILDSLVRYGDSVLFSDIDCEFQCNPESPWQFPWSMNEEWPDMAIYDWKKDPENVKGFPCDPNHMLCSSGVVFFDYSAGAFNLLVRWISAIRPNGPGDDLVLDAAVNDAPGVARIGQLGKLFNWMPALFGEPPPDTIILHDYQAGSIRDAKI